MPDDDKANIGITWAKVNLALCYHMASIDHNELISLLNLKLMNKNDWL